MKKSHFLVIGLAWALFTGWTCPVQAAVVDRILVIVNGKLITQSDFQNVFEPIQKKIEAALSGSERDRTLRETRQTLLNRMIDGILIDQEAAKMGIVVDDEEVRGTIQNILTQKNITMADFEKILDQEGLSMEAYRKEIRDQIVRSRIVRYELRSLIVVTDEEIGEYYMRNRRNYDGQEAVRIKQIVMFFPEQADQNTKQKISREMRDVLLQLQKGESFEKMAVQFSQGPTAREGGDIGYIPRGIMPPEVEQIAFTMEPGRISDIIESEQGLSIITVTDKRAGGSAMIESAREEIKERIMESKIEKRYDDWIADLRKKSLIIIKN
jgi:peptidyl-prolyl cis-trans isomerase SurA